MFEIAMIIFIWNAGLTSTSVNTIITVILGLRLLLQIAVAATD